MSPNRPSGFEPRVERVHQLSRAYAIFCARQVLGLIFMMAGFWKVFGLGPIEHARLYFLPFAERSFLPMWSLWLAGTTIPIVEWVAGMLVMLGWRTRFALFLLGGVLMVVTFGHLLDKPLFELHIHVLPRLALLIFILMQHPSEDQFSVEHWLRRRSLNK